MSHTHYPRDWVFADSGFPIAVRAPYRSPDETFAEHGHDFSELTVILEGSGRHVSGPTSWDLQAGDVFVTKEGDRHGYQNATGMVRQLVLYGHEAFLEHADDLLDLPGYHALFHLEPNRSAAQRAEAGRLRLQPQDLALVEDLLGRMVHEQDQQPLGAKTMLRGLFLQLVVTLSRCFDATPDPAARAMIRTARVQRWLAQHYDEEVTTEDLARIAEVSPTHLRRLFKETTGTSPIDHLIQLRLQKSCQLLKATDLAIIDIAMRVGFNDSNYFTRQFTKQFGCSPSRWRQRQNPIAKAP